MEFYYKKRLAIMERDNYCCQKCDSKKNLELHHRDLNTKNNDIDNLIVYCKTCHTKLHEIHRQRERDFFNFRYDDKFINRNYISQFIF